jgi:hypothetical protein
MVRGLSGFGGSDMLCEASGSDLNSFCCMLRTLVAMMRGEREGGKERSCSRAHLFTHTNFTLSPFHPSHSTMDDVARDTRLLRTQRSSIYLPGISDLSVTFFIKQRHCARVTSMMGVERVLTRSKGDRSGV